MSHALDSFISGESAENPLLSFLTRTIRSDVNDLNGNQKERFGFYTERVPQRIFLHLISLKATQYIR